MQTQYLIPKNPQLPQGEDYKFLYDQGLEWIKQFGSDIWTDFNLHDPGMTMLEMLAYTFTELGHKASFPVNDILTRPDGTLNLPDYGLYAARDIFTTAPVTPNDYRKAIIDSSAYILNAWVNPGTSKGTFDVALLLDDHTENEQGVVETVEKTLQHWHSVGEQPGNVYALQKEKLQIKLDVEMEKGARAEEVVAAFLYRIVSYLSPPVNFYTVSEMLKQGATPAEVFSGPALRHGCIPDSELFDQPTAIDVTDIINIIRNTTGVTGVTKILVNTDSEHVTVTNTLLQLESGYILTLDTSDMLKHLKVWMGGNEILITSANVDNYYRQMESASSRSFRLHPDKRANDLPLPTGVYRHFMQYYSLQNTFPHVYGIGEEGLPSTSTSQRKAQAAQLKGYLLFFEQVMANFLAQLENIPSLFSVEKQTTTYFFNPLYTVPNVPYLLKPFTDYRAKNKTASRSDHDLWELFRTDPKNDYIKKGGVAMRQSEDFSGRRNSFLDYLLRIYNEELPIYAPSTSYEQVAKNIDITIKQAYLKQYPVLSQNRAVSGDFDMQGGQEANLRTLLNIPNRPDRPIYNMVSEVISVRKIPEGTTPEIIQAASSNQYSFVGDNKTIKDFFRFAVQDKQYQLEEEGKTQALTLNMGGDDIQLFTEGAMEDAYTQFTRFQQNIVKLSKKAENFYVIDHSDLGRYPADPSLVDPSFYLFRMSYVFPGFTVHFAEHAYRDYVETLIFQYTPAHIRPYVWWLELDELRSFEQYYYNLKSASQNPLPGTTPADASEAMALFLYGLTLKKHQENPEQ